MKLIIKEYGILAFSIIFIVICFIFAWSTSGFNIGG
jgi:hypothetical protein